MTKISFAQYTVSRNGVRDIEEATAELQREMDTRKRIFDKWVLEGRMSWMDAHDRMERLMSAIRLLLAYDKRLSEEHDQQSESNTSPLPLETTFPLADEHHEAVA